MLCFSDEINKNCEEMGFPTDIQRELLQMFEDHKTATKTAVEVLENDKAQLEQQLAKYGEENMDSSWIVSLTVLLCCRTISIKTSNIK